MKTFKIIVYVPLAQAEQVRQLMGLAGAGIIGNYSNCSFSSVGKGRFKPEQGASPTVGQVGNAEVVEEERIEMNCSESKIKEVIDAMKKAHPYEEVAYDIYERIEL